MKKIILLAVLIAASTTVVVAGLNSAIINRDNGAVVMRRMPAQANVQKDADGNLIRPCQPGNASSTPGMKPMMRPMDRMERMNAMATPGGLVVATGTATATPAKPGMRPCAPIKDKVKQQGVIMRLLQKFFFGSPVEDPAVKEELKKAVVEMKNDLPIQK